MALSLPLKNVKSITDTTAGGTSTQNYVFLLPQDAGSCVVRCYAGTTFSGTSPTADVYFQTSEDNGTTWRDVAHFSQMTTGGTLQNAQWVTLGTLTTGNGSITTAAASNLGAGKVSGIPILGQANRVSIVYGGTTGTNSGINVDVFQNTQVAARN